VAVKGRGQEARRAAAQAALHRADEAQIGAADRLDQHFQLAAAAQLDQGVQAVLAVVADDARGAGGDDLVRVGDDVRLRAAARKPAHHAAVAADQHARPGAAEGRALGAGQGGQGRAAGEVLVFEAAEALQQGFEFLRCVHALIWSATGSLRMRLPVALNSALHSAGAIGGVPGSPTPVGFSADGTMCTSTAGISLMRSGMYWWKLLSCTTPSLSVMAPCRAALRP